jgi:pilus assembly protein CpaB
MAASQNIAIGFIGGAVLVAAGAVYGVFALIDRNQGTEVEEVKEVETVTVVAASRTLYQGVSIAPEDLFVVNVPPDYLPVVANAETGEVTEAEVFSSRELVVGQVPRERILKNEYIRPERLADGSAGVGLNAVIPRGMRAVSLEVRGEHAVTGFLEPGNYVDVLVTMEDELNRTSTETLLQAVFVLGVNSKAENETEQDAADRGKQRPSVTFLVTPKQAEELVFADELGTVSLALRNVQDVTYENLSSTDLASLLARYKAAPGAPVEITRIKTVRPVIEDVTRGPQIDIIRGPVRVTVEAKNLENQPLPGDASADGRKRDR